MTTLQKSLVGLALVAAIGVVVRQGRDTSQLREQLKTSNSSSQPDGPGTTASHNGTRKTTAKEKGKLTPAQLEAELLSLAEIGVDQFGSDNLSQLIADARVKDIPHLLTVVDAKMPGDLRHHFHEAWLGRWAQADDQAALHYATLINDTSSDGIQNLWRQAIAIVLGKMAEKDPTAARKAAETSNAPGHLQILETMADITLQDDPIGTLNWAMTTFPNGVEDHYYDELFRLTRQWSEENPAQVWQWALALPDGEIKSRFMSNLAEGAAKASPLEVGNEVAKMPPGDDQNAAAAAVASIWSKTDPRAASEWTAQFPDEQSRRTAMREIGGNWITQDPAAARAWVHSLPPGNEQQDAMWGMNIALLYIHPEEVADIAQSLTDSKRRDFAIRKIGDSIFKRDPSAARQWLEGNGVAEEEMPEHQEDHNE